METDLAESSFFIIVIVAFVFIEGELAVGSRIDTDFQVVPLLFGCVLHCRAEGHDGTGFHIHRHDVDGAWHIDRLPSGMQFVRPKVVPFGTLGQIDFYVLHGLGHIGY